MNGSDETILPSFESFNLIGIKPIYEVGEAFPNEVPSQELFTWQLHNPEVVSESSMYIIDNNRDNIILSGLIPSNDTIDYTFNEQITFTEEGTYSWTINAESFTGTKISKDFSVDWKGKIYYGSITESAEITEEVIHASSISELRSTPFDSLFELPENGRKFIAYPSALGECTKIVDVVSDQSLVCDSPVYLNITNEFGVTMEYIVYVTSYSINDTIKVEIKK